MTKRGRKENLLIKALYNLNPFLIQIFNSNIFKIPREFELDIVDCSYKRKIYNDIKKVLERWFANRNTLMRAFNRLSSNCDRKSKSLR